MRLNSSKAHDGYAKSVNRNPPLGKTPSDMQAGVASFFFLVDAFVHPRNTKFLHVGIGS